ncbi:MAG TPA: hypothetical protein VMV55_07255 [Methanoregula sp.]|nr:hypothetical protein [Methanoregula sp.]
MITFSLCDVKQRFGQLPAQCFSLLVNDRAGIAEGIGRYPSRSTMAGETMSWWYAPGAELQHDRRMEVAG